MPWRYRQEGGRVEPQELRQPWVQQPPGTQAPPQGPGRSSSVRPPGLTCGDPPLASLAEASVAEFQPEPVNSRVWACPQPRRPTRGSAHPGTAPMARPLAALRDPSLLLPALLSAAARPLTSHSVLRATPPRAQRAATPRPPRHRERRRAPRIHRPRCLPASLALYSFSHCLPCQNTTRVTCPNNSQPTLVTSSAEAARAGCYGNAAARSGVGDWGPVFPEQGLRGPGDPQGPPAPRA